MPATTSGSSSRPIERFHLSGPSRPLDPRTHAFRGDIADIALADRVFAPHYARAASCRAIALTTPIRARPSSDAPARSELILGETFAVVDRAGGWAWGYSADDGYVGYVPESAIGAAPEPSHRVTAPAALLFAAPDIKAPVVARWPLGTRFAGEDQGVFVECAEGFVHRRHVRLLEDSEDDPVDVAERLIGVPYRWGGRSGDGLDCSGMVQMALALTGRAAPRDSDQQCEGLGEELPEGEPLRRGDLVFFPGHVGLMADAARLVHANAYWMAVVTEPLADVIGRIAGDHPQPVLARRRIA